MHRPSAHFRYDVRQLMLALRDGRCSTAWNFWHELAWVTRARWPRQPREQQVINGLYQKLEKKCGGTLPRGTVAGASAGRRRRPGRR